MTTECTQRSFSFPRLGRRAVEAGFDGGTLTSEGGGLLLREVERQTGILKRFGACFTDHRDPERIEFTAPELIAQRVYGLALGYEDVNDHDQLRRDPMLAILVGKEDVSGQDRRCPQDVGSPLAGKSTLNRLERTPADLSNERYRKIVANHGAIEEFLVDSFLQSYAQPPERIILDLDSTDDPVHGKQEGRFFHGYYNEYCYLPLYVFCGSHPLCAQLRPANIDASKGALEQLQRIIGQIRQSWPQVEIWIRADSGFAREPIMRWCEENGVEYVLGLARNARLVRAIGRDLFEARKEHERTGHAARRFRDFRYRTQRTWSRARRVVGKAEHLAGKSNPRFVVTSRRVADVDARRLYEQVYCARGDMENRIKEQQLYLFADRTSASTMRANQLRLWFSTVAYLLLDALRRLGLAGTDLAHAQCDTIRLKLLKIGAQIRISVRRVRVALASGYPYVEAFARAYAALRPPPERQGRRCFV